MNLSDLNNESWPKKAVQALDAWQQGDIVNVGKHVMWVGVGGVDELTGTKNDLLQGELVLASSDQRIDADGKPIDTPVTTGYAVIITQTCDVIGAPPGDKQPWVQVSPICEVTDPSDIASIRRGWLLNHALVTADLGLPGTYAVDLRHSFPVSKSVLLQQERRSAFTDETDVLRLAERLAVKAGRASHHDLIGGSLASALKAFVAAEIDGGTWTSPIEQFRIVILDGTRLQPRRIKLLVITHADATRDLTKPLNAAFHAWKRRERKTLPAAQIDVEPPAYIALKDLHVADYRNAVHLPVEEVTRNYWF